MVNTDFASGRSAKSAEFCRTCDDFKSWAKMKGRQNYVQDDKKVEATDLSAPSTDHRGCPLDKDDLGRSSWGFLHTIAAYYPENPSKETKDDALVFFDKFAKLYPCQSCSEHFRQIISSDPPKVTNQTTLSQWLCKMHNLVNQRVGKPIFDCSQVNERWRDGWADGSCD